MRVPSIVGAVLLASFVGCGSPPPAPSPDVEDHICPVLFPAGNPVDTVTVALLDFVDARHAPNWTNRSEQILFGHVYETLSIESSTCQREPLARVVLSDSGRVATFTLRPGASFWDGTPVRSRDVTAILLRSGSSLPGVHSIVALDERRFEMRLTTADFDWAMLESPALAIIKSGDSWWPMGTGRYRIAHQNMGSIIAEPMREKDPVIRFINSRNVDPRDIVDGSFRPLVDVVVLDEAVPVEYARSQGLQRVELFPAEAYVLVSPVRANAIHRGTQIPMIPLSALQSIARDAVTTANAQALEESDPRWIGGRSCGTGGDDVEKMPLYLVEARAHRIAYDVTDTISREIVERVISIAGGDTSLSDIAAIHAALPGLSKKGKPLVAAAMKPEELMENLREGVEFAYVLRVPGNRPEPCFLSAQLLSVAPWLAPAGVERKVLPLFVVGSYLFAAKVDRGYGYDLRLDPYGGFIVVGRDPEEPR